MSSWTSWIKDTAQSTLSVVAGTAEPIYGPEALHSVALQEDQNPKYEVKNEDLHWRVQNSTAAETQTWYIQCNNGHYAIVQIIYTNVSNIHITAQFNLKVFHPDGTFSWSTKPLSNYEFDEEKRSFYADDLSITLSEDYQTYNIKSVVDPDALVDMKITRVAPAFMVGKDGRTNYGTDPKNPWGCIRHLFWPRVMAEGAVVCKGQKIETTGQGMFVMALQGMKPHHAAAAWDFLTFQSPKYSAVMMQFKTPPSYGSSVVNVSGITTPDSLVAASTKGTVEHYETKTDEVTEWPEPTALRYTWRGKTQDGKDVEGVIEGKLDAPRKDRVDFLAEVPQIIKSIVGGVVGTKPFIYQYSQPMKLKLKIGDETIEEEGTIFAEATFIS
ncbi:oxidative stress survival, Svf1-like protein [Ascodesmis nigricans]|uniref:Oxidative stress survival, Svf1-like protein n=1 Tax=Ascodesmis nigricans TaxID=341454 RepID=A0A4S2MWB8_9PEZI|nr:oxidative stress survival, Svf1-like protein [Ascodesmis nigricans]